MGEVAYLNCPLCNKEHKAVFGVFPEEQEKLLDYIIIYDPNDSTFFIFNICVYADTGIVSFAASCKLGEEVVITYLNKLPFEIPGIIWTKNLLSRKEILDSDFKDTAFSLIQTVMTTDETFRPIFKQWSKIA